ncbi:PH and SEC7 domain-containing protein 3 [Elysia marginata]|uniref:PH and SEC7 domain-containing protein 3 n=1 Tax=Elysia marginata TaxID=1093978 RepID=A0AAV4I8V9_9GAST|nr:PH and SEC7 domain-containing protein 3 [Elysia marginata]
MASKAFHSPSRLPLPVRTKPYVAPTSASVYSPNSIGVENNILPEIHKISHCDESRNGNITEQAKGGPVEKGINSSLMTGDMLISNTLQDSQLPVNEIHTLDKKDNIPESKSPEIKQINVKSSKNTSKIARFVKNQAPQSPKFPTEQETYSMATTASSQVSDFPFVQAPVAEIEELSDLSQSSCSDSDFNNGPSTSTPSLPSTHQTHSCSDAPPSMADTSSRLEEAAETLSKVQAVLPESSNPGACDMSFSEPPSSGDSGFVHDGHVSDPELPDKGLAPVVTDHMLFREGGYTSDETLTEKRGMSDSSFTSSNSPVGDYPRHGMVTSRSGEKFGVSGSSGDRNLVRTSKSHENYLQAGTGIAFVNIDIDDNLAYSLDTLTYHDSPESSSDNVALEPAQMSRSLDNSPDKKPEKFNGEREFLLDNNLEDTKQVKLKENEVDADTSAAPQTNNSGNSCVSSSTVSYSRNKDVDVEDFSTISNGLSAGHVFNTPSGDSLNLSVLSDESDADSLYHQPSKGVDRPSAVRLAKRLFHLEGFRKSDVSRHLSKKNDFSNLVAEEYLRFFDFEDNTLDSALRKFLIQFSLDGETQERERVLAHFSHRFMECNPGSFNSNVTKRMTCQAFIENLAELNDGENFQEDVLKAIYQAIKNEPIEWATDELSPDREGLSLAEQAQLSQAQMSQAIGSNPFLDVPDPSKTTEYKRGYVMRKCCMEPDRRKSLDSKELQEWVDSINLVAASLSAPPLPGAVGSRAKFQRQLLPSTYTRLNLKEQLQSHRSKVNELEQDLHNHRAAAPEKGAKSSVCQDYIDKELYLEFELKRFKIYVYLLNSKLSQFPADVLEPSLVETTIGENEEFIPPAGVISSPLSGAPATVDLTQIAVSVPVAAKGGAVLKPEHPHQPSLSDRYSYRAAIYQTDSEEYDML